MIPAYMKRMSLGCLNRQLPVLKRYLDKIKSFVEKKKKDKRYNQRNLRGYDRIIKRYQAQIDFMEKRKKELTKALPWWRKHLGQANYVIAFDKNGKQFVSFKSKLTGKIITYYNHEQKMTIQPKRAMILPEMETDYFLKKWKLKPTHKTKVTSDPPKPPKKSSLVRLPKPEFEKPEVAENKHTSYPVYKISKESIQQAWRESPLMRMRIMTMNDREYYCYKLADWKKIFKESEPLNKKFPYVAERRDCDKFMAYFKGITSMKYLISGVGMVIDYSGGHAYNLLAVKIDQEPYCKLVAFEPQNYRFPTLGSGQYKAERGIILF